MQIQQALREYIVNELADDQLPQGFDDDLDLIESGIMDSHFMMGLITYLESEHQIKFGMNDMVPKHFKSINALSSFARSQMDSLV